MTYVSNWEEFEKAAEMLYLQNPLQVRYSMKYAHAKGAFLVKITDDKKVSNWEEFEKAAEMLYLQNPLQVRYSMKYAHAKGAFLVKITDDKKCLQFKTEVLQDVRKVDKFISNLLRHMASNDR